MKASSLFVGLIFWPSASFLLAGPQPPPEQPKIQYRLDEMAGKPGDLVKLTMSIITNVKLTAVSVAINFDEGRLHADSVERVFSPVAPAPVDDAAAINLDNRDDSAGNQAKEGWVYFELSAGKNTDGDLLIPLNEPVPLFQIVFKILDGAPAGFTPVEFSNLGPVKVLNQSVLLANSVDVRRDGEAQPMAPLAEDLENGGVTINIIGEIGFFLRGDTTMDLVRDISDPIRTLRYLFQGDKNMPCEDAADANDDGRIDVSDAIFTLERLFSSSNPFPEPNGFGPDPTEDLLTCEHS